jgi:hypothetical protein
MRIEKPQALSRCGHRAQIYLGYLNFRSANPGDLILHLLQLAA